MPYERLKSARKTTVGSKQTLKAIERGQAKLVFVARNADSYIVDPVIRASKLKDIKVLEVDSMKLLGQACGIDVGCASASIIEL